MNMEIVDATKLRAEVERTTAPDAQLAATIAAQAAQHVHGLAALSLSDTAGKRELVKAMEEFGADILQNTARRRGLFQTTIANLSRSGESSGLISDGLAALHGQIAELDPGNLNFARPGILGRLFNPVQRYFEKFEGADEQIEAILAALDRGKATLKNDNTTLDLEEDYLREATAQLSARLQLGTELNEQLVRLMGEGAFDADAEKKRFIAEEILYPLERRVADMQQMAMVNYQAIIAIQLVKRSNMELIRGVDRARSVTLSALRTGVMLAGAMYNQKLALRQIGQMNSAADSLIGTTGQMLRQHAPEIQRQTAETGLSPEALKGAFADALATIDEISESKRRALPQMQQSIAQFQTLVQQGEQQTARLQGFET